MCSEISKICYSRAFLFRIFCYDFAKFCAPNFDYIFAFVVSFKNYTVKSGYHVQRAVDKEDVTNQVHSSPLLTHQHNLINRLWNLSIPPQLKIFWWKVLHKGLSVAENLNMRGIIIYRYCQVCGEEIENIYHMLISCRVPKEIWSFSLSELSCQHESDNAIFEVFQNLMDIMKNSQPLNNLPFFVGWRIWKIRNKLVYENKRDHIAQVVNVTLMDERVWREANHDPS